MREIHLTNALLVVLIILLAVMMFRPNLDSATSASAQAAGRPGGITAGESANADALASIAKSGEAIAKAIEGLGASVEKAGNQIATVMQQQAQAK